MDFAGNTDDYTTEIKFNQENVLLEIVREICSDKEGKLPSKLKGKVNRVLADCDLMHHSSLHRVSAADETTTTVLGFMHQTSSDLTYEEQAELNQAFIDKIKNILPDYNRELEQLIKNYGSCSKIHEDQIKELKERDSNLDTLQEQESEKMELMMEWLNHRIQEISTFGNNSSDLLMLKTKILNLKSKILHLQILQNIFTETNQSLKAYKEVHKDLKDNIKETEERIKKYREIIGIDLN